MFGGICSIIVWIAAFVSLGINDCVWLNNCFSDALIALFSIVFVPSNMWKVNNLHIIPAPVLLSLSITEPSVYMCSYSCSGYFNELFQVLICLRHLSLFSFEAFS